MNDFDENSKLTPEYIIEKVNNLIKFIKSIN